jgi:hypothetical protein
MRAHVDSIYGLHPAAGPIAGFEHDRFPTRINQSPSRRKTGKTGTDDNCAWRLHG